MNDLITLLDNGDELDLNKTEYYASILGVSPSKGAKSPVLWNEAFKRSKISAMMHPMDVKADNLKAVVRAMREDSRFIGSAVTMPYKKDIIPYLDEIEPEADIIGAVNCIYKKSGKLAGANTDGAGALWSLENFDNGNFDLKGKTVLLLGTGGAGSAVATYVANEIGEKGKMLLSNRSTVSRDDLSKRIEHMCEVIKLDWPVTADQVLQVNVVINCSSVGFETMQQDGNDCYSLKCFSPLAPVNDLLRVPADSNNIERKYMLKNLEKIKDNINYSLDVLSAMSSPLVFDIIYQPENTVLLSLAYITDCRTLNGVGMNLEQAVIAFDKATVAMQLRESNCEVVRRYMEPLW